MTSDILMNFKLNQAFNSLTGLVRGVAYVILGLALYSQFDGGNTLTLVFVSISIIEIVQLSIVLRLYKKEISKFQNIQIGDTSFSVDGRGNLFSLSEKIQFDSRVNFAVRLYYLYQLFLSNGISSIAFIDDINDPPTTKTVNFDKWKYFLIEFENFFNVETTGLLSQFPSYYLQGIVTVILSLFGLIYFNSVQIIFVILTTIIIGEILEMMSIRIIQKSWYKKFDINNTIQFEDIPSKSKI